MSILTKFLPGYTELMPEPAVNDDVKRFKELYGENPCTVQHDFDLCMNENGDVLWKCIFCGKEASNHVH